MKIAFLNIYQDKVNRGAETFIKELSSRLSRNHEVEVLSKINYLRLLKSDYDLIIPTNGRSQVVLVRIITWLSGKKMIVSGQSGIGWDDRVNLYSFPSAFIALSSKAKNWAKKVNPFVKSLYIPNGVDIERFKIQGDSFKTGLKRPIVLTVGAFTKQKRLNLAIRAVARIKDASLFMVGGGGELKEELTKLGTELMEGRFKIVSIPFEKMPEVYRAADVFTLPSASSESFGNVLVEAMATGLPVVATKDEVRKEIIGDAGVLVDPIDTDTYKETLRNALETDWNSKPRKQAEKFDWEKIAEKYEELFKTLFKKD